MFCITGKLVFKSYKPLKLERGMYFLIRDKDEMTISELDNVPMNEEEYIQMYGYPVEPYIIHPGNPNVASDGYVISHPHKIGWFDEGEDSDELYTITVNEINNIIDFYDSWVDVEVEEELDSAGRPIPVTAQGYHILSYSNLDDEDDDDNEYFFEDDEEYTPPSSNDEWENNNFTNPSNRRHDQD
jgi:hypothetical protein